MKRDLLFDNPLSSKIHDSSIVMENLREVVINATFKGEKAFFDIIQQCNEYMNSLFMSQLEFKMPLVFSSVARNRLMKHEPTIGVISKCLDNSQSMTPSIVKILCDDRTATTTFQVIHETTKGQRTVLKNGDNQECLFPQMFAIRHF